MTRTGEVTTGVRAVLSRPTVYDLFERLLGSDRARTTFVREHLRMRPGDRLLDVGCGPGDLLAYLDEDVEYVGIDVSASYIEHARERFGSRGTFLVGDAASLPEDLRGFDVAVATGVLHHLDDAQAAAMMTGIAQALGADGRFVGIEPTFVAGQHWLAGTAARMDRGQHVRSPEAYAAVARSGFTSVETTVTHGLLRIPYSHCILGCQGPRTA